MSELKRPTCKTCLYWENASDDYGLCRRRPPNGLTPSEQALKNDTLITWPETNDTDWCGEHHLFSIYVATMMSPKFGGLRSLINE